MNNFYQTIVNSEKWKAWEEEQRKRLKRQHEEMNEGYRYKFEEVFDIDECREADMLSEKHWKEFVEFMQKQARGF